MKLRCARYELRYKYNPFTGRVCIKKGVGPQIYEKDPHFEY